RTEQLGSREGFAVPECDAATRSTARYVQRRDMEVAPYTRPTHELSRCAIFTVARLLMQFALAPIPRTSGGMGTLGFRPIYRGLVRTSVRLCVFCTPVWSVLYTLGNLPLRSFCTPVYDMVVRL